MWARLSLPVKYYTPAKNEGTQWTRWEKCSIRFFFFQEIPQSYYSLNFFPLSLSAFVPNTSHFIRLCECCFSSIREKKEIILCINYCHTYRNLAILPHRRCTTCFVFTLNVVFFLLSRCSHSFFFFFFNISHSFPWMILSSSQQHSVVNSKSLLLFFFFVLLSYVRSFLSLWHRIDSSKRKKNCRSQCVSLNKK